MTSRTEALIDTLAAGAVPIAPLRSPLRRALTTLAIVTLLGGLAIFVFSDLEPLAARGEGGRTMAALELLAMLMTGALAVIAAFHLSIPGRSRAWLAAPVVPLTAWLLLSGIGCYGDFVRNGPSGWEIGHSGNCLIFILGASALLAIPLIGALARARPIAPLPVAALAGLGMAALSAFVLQFFHPFAVSFIDLAIHIVAVLIVVGLNAAISRGTLRPA